MQLLLKSFPAEARRAGAKLFREGRVRKLSSEAQGYAYSAEVEEDGSGAHGVHLEYDGEEERWWGTCTCPAGYDCQHLFAAGRALQAEHSAAIVRSLSSGFTPAPGPRETAEAKPPPPPPSVDIPTRLRTALGRSLKSAETKFVGKLRNVLARCQMSRRITYWDLEELGIHLGGYGWDALEIWPSVPKDEYDFWLYIANAAKEQGAPIPAFMERITDLDLIKGRLAQWRREREIDKWKQKLGQLLPQAAPVALAESGETDLRLAIEEAGPRLYYRRPGFDTYEALKPAHIQSIWHQRNEGAIQFTTEGEVLWELFGSRAYLGGCLRYNDPQTSAALGRALRTRLLEGRITDSVGVPLVRVTEPLRWEISPAKDETDDYRLRLVRGDGSPVPQILCVLPGRPALYLSRDAVFEGPPPHTEVLSLAAETRIPAPAIERTSGVAFLQSLGVALPESVRERVRTLPFAVTIHCELQPIHYGSRTEDCVVDVTAAAADGRQEHWNGATWTSKQPKPSQRRSPKESPNSIVLYDWATLEPIPALMAPLSLKTDPYSGRLTLRVNRKFPEVFASWLKGVPPHIRVELVGELASFASSEVSGRVKLDVTETEIDWFDLRVVLDVSDTTLTQAEINLLLNAKGGYVRLAGKGWRRLQFDLSEEENERLANLGLNPRELSAEPQRLHALQLADEAAKKFLPEQQVEQIQRRAGEIKARVAPELPATITAQLRPYQVEGYHFLAYLAANRFGGILADDMGLGKTLQALAWLAWLREEAAKTDQGAAPEPANGEVPPQAGGTGLPSLVVCPKSVMDNWQAEAARFAPALRVRVWAASELPNLREGLATANLHVMNYSQLRILGEGAGDVHWQAVILDEGQYIKNPNSQTAQAARSLRADNRLVLSGTPIENRLLDLWSLLAFAMPGVLGSRAYFAKIYDPKGDPMARRRLSSRVRPFLLRRTKAQVAKDLPDRVEEDLFCEIEGEQQMLYRAELKRAQQLLLGIKTQKELAQQQFHFLTSLLRLRQICCHPRLVNPQAPPGNSAKTEALMELLEPLMEEGERVLVFSQFVEMLELLKPEIEARQWPRFWLTGETENRGALVSEFQSCTGPAVFLISLKAGGFGLNLTAASYVVLFDPWWNPAVEAQAIDRTHRIGQTNKVMAYRLLIKNSIEEKIRQLQKKKQALAQDVLGEERFSQSLTIEDLQYLFAD